VTCLRDAKDYARGRKLHHAEACGQPTFTLGNGLHSDWQFKGARAVETELRCNSLRRSRMSRRITMDRRNCNAAVETLRFGYRRADSERSRSRDHEKRRSCEGKKHGETVAAAETLRHDNCGNTCKLDSDYVDFRRANVSCFDGHRRYGRAFRANRVSAETKKRKRNEKKMCRFPSSARKMRFHAYQSMTCGERPNGSGELLSRTIMCDKDVSAVSFRRN